VFGSWSLLGHQTAISKACLIGAAVSLLLLGFGRPAGATTAELRLVDPVSDVLSGCLLQAFPLRAGVPDEVSLPRPQDGEPFVDPDSIRTGKLRLAGGEYTVGVSLGTEGAVLVADTDQSGQLTVIPWDGMTGDQRLIAAVSFRIYDEPQRDRDYPLLLLWDPFVPSVIAYCRGGYASGFIQLGEAEFLVAVVDEDTDGLYDDLASGTLFIDADQDGELLATMDSHEQFALDEPFNLMGTTYVVTAVAADGSMIVVEESDLPVAMKVPLTVGSIAPSFTAATANGETVSLAGLRERVVLLDFWAGWCSPCIRELPVVQALHDAWPKTEFIVLGINLDRSEAAMDRAVEEHNLTYTQVFDEEDEISDLYRISGIPMTYVVDRSGIIVARGLRGQELVEAVESELAHSREPDSDADRGETPINEEGS